ESGGRLPVALQSLQEILFRQGRPFAFQCPVTEVSVLLSLRRLAVQASIEQGMGFLKLAIVHLHPAQQAQGRCVIGLQCQCLIEIFAAFPAGLQPLHIGQPIAVGLPVRQVSLQNHPRHLGLNRAGKMSIIMLYLHGTPRYQPLSNAAKVCSFLTVCRGLEEVLRKVCQFLVWGLTPTYRCSAKSIESCRIRTTTSLRADISNMALKNTIC